MLLAKFLDSFLTDGAIIIIDHKGRPHFCGSRTREPAITVRFRSPRPEWRLLFNPQVAAGEGYTSGDIIIEKGTLRDFMELVFRHQQIASELTWIPYTSFIRSFSFPLHPRNVRFLAGKHIRYHYDIGNDIYRIFLGPTMEYSCAYFPDTVIPVGKEKALTRYHENRIEDLDSAQTRKRQHIIAKLQLSDGMRVLDVGCGWGGLALEIAEAYNVQVVGITLSQAQLDYARASADDRGLSNRVIFEMRDYRDVNQTFDRIVSVGMFEHVGAYYYQQFFRAIENALTDEGIFLLHTIGCVNAPGRTNPWLRKYIFPGGYIPALSEIVKASEATGLRLSDVEVLRLHYAFTLREWNRRFQDAASKVLHAMGQEFFRLWEFYLTSSEMSFLYGRFVNYQLQFAKSRFTLPITRDYLYARSSSAMIN